MLNVKNTNHKERYHKYGSSFSPKTSFTEIVGLLKRGFDSLARSQTGVRSFESFIKLRLLPLGTLGWESESLTWTCLLPS